jgi:hypothetical protein
MLFLTAALSAAVIVPPLNLAFTSLSFDAVGLRQVATNSAGEEVRSMEGISFIYMMVDNK